MMITLDFIITCYMERFTGMGMKGYLKYYTKLQNKQIFNEIEIACELLIFLNKECVYDISNSISLKSNAIEIIESKNLKWNKLISIISKENMNIKQFKNYFIDFHKDPSEFFNTSFLPISNLRLAERLQKNRRNFEIVKNALYGKDAISAQVENMFEKYSDSGKPGKGCGFTYNPWSY